MIEEDELDFTETGKKILALYHELEKTASKNLQKFTHEELLYVQQNWGLSFVYPVFKDISEILREPESSDSIH